jgi:hypothetical protein
MHFITPVASTVGAVAFTIALSMAVLFLIVFLVSLFLNFGPKVDTAFNVGFIVALSLFIVGVLVTIGSSFAATQDMQGQLQNQAQARYGIELSNIQVGQLQDVEDSETREATIAGGKTKVHGSTVIDGNRVIFLVQQGDAYLLESANLTELPTR